MSGSIVGNTWQMIMNTGLFGKFILLVLLALSGYSWAIIITKIRRFKKLRKGGDKIMRIIGNHRGVEILRLSLPMRDHPIALVVDSVRQELGPQYLAGGVRIEDSSRAALFEGLSQRADSAVEDALEREERSVDFLAMTASVSPFLGLLGTVWGITQSFWEIGRQASANIAVVAPGLAEALITTIAGLVVAIPAVIAFNLFTSRLRVLAGDASGFGKRFVNQLKREL
ncbi:MAG TPA: hypothetical protein ENN07_03515 [candidate division Zixibacteria bacterium]|nr:hypothetical protein [candidate division Zixibacteria bacterium]